MVNAKEWLKIRQKFHRYKSLTMPNGFRVAKAAMKKLGIERTGNSFLNAVVELIYNNCATCFADCVQVITGYIFGKGNIEKSYKCKLGLTLIDKQTKRAERVMPKAETMILTKNFFFLAG